MCLSSEHSVLWIISFNPPSPGQVPPVSGPGSMQWGQYSSCLSADVAYVGNFLMLDPTVSPSPPLTILGLHKPQKPRCSGTGTAVAPWSPEQTLSPP